jgi:hypothetical protein
MFRLLRSADPEVVAYRAADILFPFFPAIPFGLTSPIDLACFAAVHLGIRHNFYLPACRQAGSSRLKIHYMVAIVNKIVV